MTMMKPIAVVGSGPAGMSAALALRLAGVPFAIFSNTDQPSRIGGAQFLHHPLPLVCNEKHDFPIRYTLVGNHQEYQRKVYGDEDVPFVSMSRVTDGEVVPAWSLQSAYEKMFEENGKDINLQVVDARLLDEWIASELFTAIIVSCPKPMVCRAHAGLTQLPHTFVSQPIRIMNESVLGEGYDNTIIYDGTPNVSWYRTSRINGTGSTEWGSGAPAKMPYKNLITVNKPMRTNCSCYGREAQTGFPQVLFVGRFGTWRKGELVHDAFDNTLGLLKELAVLS
jgi:hypothetical protein